MNILAFDTTTSYQSIALAKNNSIVAETIIYGKRDHSKYLMPNILKLLEESNMEMSQLDTVSTTIGPGSFTGIRIALSTAKGICFGLKKPLVNFSTLTSLANNLNHFEGNIAIIMEAGRDEIYFSLFDTDLKQIIKPELTILDKVIAKIDRKTVIGGYLTEGLKNDLKKYGTKINIASPQYCYPRASSIMDMIIKNEHFSNYKYNLEEISNLKPIYIRSSAAEERLKK